MEKAKNSRSEDSKYSRNKKPAVPENNSAGWFLSS
jgi:hypothetical protein